MIIILTDEIESWFRYIWEQFVEINSLTAEYILISYAEYILQNNTRDIIVLEYGIEQRHPNSLFIPKSKRYKTDDYVWIGDDLPVYRGTIAENGDYDLFYNAFVHLSRLEEWESESNGKLIRSYSSLHPKKDKIIWRIPVVNYLFNELEERIKKRFSQIKFGNGTKPTIEFSHDVDYLDKTIQLRIKQSAFNFFNVIKYLLKWDLGGSFSKFGEGIGFAVRKSDYWCFDYWDALENKFSVKSVYYFFAKKPVDNKCNLKQWLIDPSYDITNNSRLKEKCKNLIAGGNAIGLHGSYYSALDEELFMKEKEVLEKAVDCQITKTRQHWLNYRENVTPYIHKRADIYEDSTLGFNDISGFRSGVASKYAPYDHAEQKPFSFKVIPLVVMDAQIYDYSLCNRNEIGFEWLTAGMRKAKNFTISVDWHQRVCSNDYRWEEGFERLLNINEKMGSSEPSS